jgi:hypothetical protein
MTSGDEQNVIVLNGQPINASLPNHTTLSGIVISDIAQLVKAPQSILSRPSGRSTLLNTVQQRKASGPISCISPLNKSNATPAPKNHAKAISSNSMLVSYHDFDVVVS